MGKVIYHLLCHHRPEIHRFDEESLVLRCTEDMSTEQDPPDHLITESGRTHRTDIGCMTLITSRIIRCAISDTIVSRHIATHFRWDEDIVDCECRLEQWHIDIDDDRSLCFHLLDILEKERFDPRIETFTDVLLRDTDT